MAFLDKLEEVAKNIGDKTTEVARNIGDKTNEVAKNISDKTSEAIETGKLNTKIKEENAAAAEDLKKIGEYFYKLYAENGECVEEIRGLCESVKAHYDAVAQARADIDKIKSAGETAKAAPQETTSDAGQSKERICPKCGAAVDEGTRFCSQCGQAIE